MHDLISSHRTKLAVADPGGDPRMPRIPLLVYSYVVALVQLLASNLSVCVAIVV